jgi:hypothetical protein
VQVVFVGKFWLHCLAEAVRVLLYINGVPGSSLLQGIHGLLRMGMGHGYMHEQHNISHFLKKNFSPPDLYMVPEAMFVSVSQ